MPTDAQPTARRDAVRNRARLLDAARELFAARGPDVALEEVARAADVSRTTLYRNFATREELAATVFEDNVALIERRADELRGRADGALVLFDLVLEMQQSDRSLTRVLAGAEITWFTGLSARTAAAFEPLVEEGRDAGLVWPGVDVDDVMLAFSMAGGAMAENSVTGREELNERLHGLLHRALFTSAG
jgi:AcrR family transcriptional regulator